MHPFSAVSRPFILADAQNQGVDLLIVGGGITGAGALLEAARRGYRCLLVEQNDFASGTSSASSKLIHGGLRYLEMGDFAEVFRSCKDRHRLLTLAPNLVYPLPFLFPSYQNQRRSLNTIYLGTFIYSLLALFRNISWPKKLSREQTLQQIAFLNPSGLHGSVAYSDAGTIDTRLTLSVLKTASSLGAMACNHAKLVQLEPMGQKKQIHCKVVDEISGIEYSICAQKLINATGAWTNQFRKTYLQRQEEEVRITKGVHILLQGNPLKLSCAVVMLSPVDQRVVFVLPWLQHTLIGTTDTDFKGDVDQVNVTLDDINYLKKTVLSYFPKLEWNSSSILSTFAGLRSLRNHINHHPSSISREHMIYQDAPGMLTVAGGKLTTFLSMAEEILDRIEDSPPRRKVPIPAFSSVMEIKENYSLEDFYQYVDTEMATTLTDLLKYRTLSYYMHKDHGSSLIGLASHAILSKLRLSQTEIERQIKNYQLEMESQYVGT